MPTNTNYNRPCNLLGILHIPITLFWLTFLFTYIKPVGMQHCDRTLAQHHLQLGVALVGKSMPWVVQEGQQTLQCIYRKKLDASYYNVGAWLITHGCLHKAEQNLLASQGYGLISVNVGVASDRMYSHQHRLIGKNLCRSLCGALT